METTTAGQARRRVRRAVEAGGAARSQDPACEDRGMDSGNDFLEEAFTNRRIFPVFIGQIEAVPSLIVGNSRLLLHRLVLTDVNMIMSGSSHAVWSRIVFSTEAGESGKMKSLARLYTTALERLLEYVVCGVEGGNFHQK